MVPQEKFHFAEFIRKNFQLYSVIGVLAALSYYLVSLKNASEIFAILVLTANLWYPELILHIYPFLRIGQDPLRRQSVPESRSEYQENILLIILLLGGLFYAWDLRGLAIGGIVSAIAVYYDAGTLHAGQKFEKESFFGDVVAWRPLTWAICVLIGSLVFLQFTSSPAGIFLMQITDRNSTKNLNLLYNRLGRLSG